MTCSLKIVFAAGLIFGLVPMNARAQDPSAPAATHFTEEEIHGVIEADLKERTKLSGTLDVYDKDANIVRHLRRLRFREGVTREDGVYTAMAEFRDTQSGARVEMAFTLQTIEDGLSVKDMVIRKITDVAAGQAVAEDREYPDAEVLDFMKKYLESQMKFTESLALFDEENQRLRSLELVAISGEVRRMGVLAIARADFRDIATGESVGVDVTVKNQKGLLEIQSLRIREIGPASSSDDAGR